MPGDGAEVMSSIEATGKEGGNIMKKRVVIEYDPAELEGAASDFGTVPTARAALAATYGVAVHGVVSEDGSGGVDGSPADIPPTGQTPFLSFVAFFMTVVMYVVPMIQVLAEWQNAVFESRWIDAITSVAVLLGLWLLAGRVLGVLWLNRSQLGS